MKKSNSNINVYERTKMLMSKHSSNNINYHTPTIMQQYITHLPNKKHPSIRHTLHPNTTNTHYYSYLTHEILSPTLYEHNTTNPFITKTLSPLRKASPHYTHNKKILFLDLDETLVHSSFQQIPKTKCDFELNIPFDNNHYKIFVYKRPYLDIFLQKLSTLYELNIFTASIQSYADKVIDVIDKDNVICKRLYRQHCTLMKDQYVKDLTPYTHNSLNNVLILDNNPISYLFNPSNGIPISTWIDDKEDEELVKVMPVLEKLAYVQDVRIKLREMMGGDEGKRSRREVSRNERNGCYGKGVTFKEKWNDGMMYGIWRDENKNVSNSFRYNMSSDNVVNMFINNKTITKYSSIDKQFFCY